jgi:hypothetical protein
LGFVNDSQNAPGISLSRSKRPCGCCSDLDALSAPTLVFFFFTQDHPSSFCCLFGLTHEELNLVLKAFGSIKKGARTFAFKVWFLMITCGNTKAFLPSKSCKSSHDSLTPRMQHVYLVGKSNGKTLVQSISEQISNNTLPHQSMRTTLIELRSKCLQEQLQMKKQVVQVMMNAKIPTKTIMMAQVAAASIR